MKVRLRSEQDTASFARACASWIEGGYALGLKGDLGAGKTTFVRYLIEALKGDIRAVASPTYTLQHEYPVRDGLTVEHWDLYRLKELPEELFGRTPKSVVRVIEWPERCPEINESLMIQITISMLVGSSSESDERVVGIEGQESAALLSRIPPELVDS